MVDGINQHGGRSNIPLVSARRMSERVHHDNKCERRLFKSDGEADIWARDLDTNHQFFAYATCNWHKHVHRLKALEQEPKTPETWS